jgi:hypothetical protein
MFGATSTPLKCSEAKLNQFTKPTLSAMPGFIGDKKVRRAAFFHQVNDTKAQSVNGQNTTPGHTAHVGITECRLQTLSAKAYLLMTHGAGGKGVRSLEYALSR